MDNNQLKVQDDVPKSFRSRLIDHLLNIRINLMVKKLVSDVISKRELNSIIDSEKQKANDDLIKKALDDTFDEYFSNKMTQDKEERGISFVKRGYFKSDPNQDSDNAA